MFSQKNQTQNAGVYNDLNESALINFSSALSEKSEQTLNA